MMQLYSLIRFWLRIKLIMTKQVKLLFAGERKVCDHIFAGFDYLTDQCFAEVTNGSVAVLLSFGDAIAKSKRSPEKLFVLLDMYEIMRELHSEVWENSFSSKNFLPETGEPCWWMISCLP